MYISEFMERVQDRREEKIGGFEHLNMPWKHVDAMMFPAQPVQIGVPRLASEVSCDGSTAEARKSCGRWVKHLGIRRVNFVKPTFWRSYLLTQVMINFFVLQNDIKNIFTCPKSHCRLHGVSVLENSTVRNQYNIH